MVSKKQYKFVECVQNYPILLANSIYRDVRGKKLKAIAEVRDKYYAQTGILLRPNQMKRKIGNMKSRIKQIMQQQKDGDEEIVLHGWERNFFQYMKRNSELLEPEPFFKCAPQGEVKIEFVAVEDELEGAENTNHMISDLVEHTRMSDDDEMPETASCSSRLQTSETSSSESLIDGLSSASEIGFKTNGNCVESKSILPETEETKCLSTRELRRLVLLEQLKTYRLAKKYFTQKAQKYD